MAAQNPLSRRKSPPVTTRHGEPGDFGDLTRAELLAIIGRSGFRVARTLAHPFLGPTSEDVWTLFCTTCGRDSGYHWDDCPKGSKR